MKTTSFLCVWTAFQLGAHTQVTHTHTHSTPTRDPAAEGVGAGHLNIRGAAKGGCDSRKQVTGGKRCWPDTRDGGRVRATRRPAVGRDRLPDPRGRPQRRRAPVHAVCARPGGRVHRPLACLQPGGASAAARPVARGPRGGARHITARGSDHLGAVSGLAGRARRPGLARCRRLRRGHRGAVLGGWQDDWPSCRRRHPSRRCRGRAGVHTCPGRICPKRTSPNPPTITATPSH